MKGPISNRYHAGICYGRDDLSSPFCNSFNIEVIIFIDAKGSGICDVGDTQVLGNLRRYLGGVTVYRLHTADYDVISVSIEDVLFDFSDSFSQRISGCSRIRSAQLSIGEQHTGIGTYRQ